MLTLETKPFNPVSVDEWAISGITNFSRLVIIYTILYIMLKIPMGPTEKCI